MDRHFMTEGSTVCGLNRIVLTGLLAGLLAACGGGGGGGAGNSSGVAGNNWGQPVAIDPDDFDADDPRLASNAAGNAIAVWVQTDATGADNIMASRYEAATGVWGAAVPIESHAGAAFQPRIAMDAAGNAVAVWIQDNASGTEESVIANRYNVATGLWGAAVPIETSSAQVNDPQVAMDAAGNAIAVWAMDDGTGVDSLFHNRFDVASGLWNLTATTIEADVGAVSYPEIAMDAAGNGFAVWVQRDPVTTDNYDLWARRYDATGGWTTTWRIESLDNRASDPNVAIDATGNAVAVWVQRDPVTGEFDIWANRYVGLGWDTETLIESVAGDAFDPEIAVGPHGDALAVWQQIDTTTGAYDVRASRYTQVSGLWDAAATTIETGSGSASDPEIAMNAAGEAFAVWEQGDGTGLGRIMVNRYDAGTGRWNGATPIGGNSGSASSVEIAVDAAGNAVAVWVEDNGMGSDDIVGASYR